MRAADLLTFPGRCTARHDSYVPGASFVPVMAHTVEVVELTIGYTPDDRDEATQGKDRVSGLRNLGVRDQFTAGRYSAAARCRWS